VVVSFIAWVLNLTGAIYLLSVGLEATRAFPFIQENFRNLIYQYNYDMVAKRTVDIIQEYVSRLMNFIRIVILRIRVYNCSSREIIFGPSDRVLRRLQRWRLG